MTIQSKEITDRSTWDMALASLPSPHILQTWDWGDFKSRWGWQPTRLLFEENHRPLAAAQILRRPLPPTGLSVTYVPKGPVIDHNNTQILVKVLAALERRTSQQHSMFIKTDPDVWVGHSTEDTSVLPGAATVLKTLAQRGWCQSAEQIQFRNTVIVDLTADEDELLSNMKSKTRYNIRLAKRRGVCVRQGDESDLSTFYRLYDETSQRDGFLIRPAAYYLDVWGQFMRAGRAHLLLAQIEGEFTAGLILFHFGRTAWYMYGASSSRHRDLMPNHLLQWEAIRLAKNLDCTRYDMWGAPDHFNDSDPLWGVYRFKTGFGGETMRGLGAFDYVVSPQLYWVYTVAMPRVRTLMRRRQQPMGPI